MKFSAKKDDLSKILSHVQSIVERRTTIPILANVKVCARDNNVIELQATDMDIWIEDKISGQVEEVGCTTIPAHMLYEIVRKFSQNPDVKFKMNELDSIKIQVDNSSEFDIPVIKSDDYPSFEELKDNTSFKINSKILHELLTKTRHAISNEETRYYLNGVYFHIAVNDKNEKVLNAVATDGHRLARAQTIQPHNADGMPSIIIPKKMVFEIIKLLDGFEGDVEVIISEIKITMKIATSIITSKLIEGNFPDYERVIPKNNDKNLKVSKKELINAIDLVTSISIDRTRAVKFNVSQKKLSISASSEMNGNARGEKEMNVDYDSDQTISIGFNSKYVLEALTAVNNDSINLSLSNNLGAIVLNEIDNNSFICILMPMQV